MKRQCSSNQVSRLRPGVSSFHQTMNSAHEHGPATRRRKADANRKKALVVGLAASLLLAFSPDGLAETPPPLNGAQPRPFYVFGHNPNVIPDVVAALAGGANALEPDISQINCGGQDYLIDFDTDAGAIANCSEIRLINWCKAV